MMPLSVCKHVSTLYKPNTLSGTFASLFWLGCALVNSSAIGIVDSLMLTGVRKLPVDSRDKMGFQDSDFPDARDRAKKRVCAEAGEPVNLADKVHRLERHDIAILRRRVEAMDDIEDRLYSSLSRLMEKYTKPMEVDMLRITSLESTIANTQQVDLPRIAKLELNHAQQQQQLELLSSSHNKSLEVELPRITRMELLVAQMQQQLESLVSSQGTATEQGAMTTASLASRLKEVDERVSGAVQGSGAWGIDISARLDEVKSEVSLLKKISGVTWPWADGSEVTYNLKGIKEEVSTLHDHFEAFASRLRELEEKINPLISGPAGVERRVKELDALFVSTVKEFESNVCINFDKKVKELELYLVSLVETKLAQRFALRDIKDKDMKESILAQAAAGHVSTRKGVDGELKKLEASLTARTSEVEKRLQGLEDLEGTTKGWQTWLESKLAKVEENVTSLLTESKKVEDTSHGRTGTEVAVKGFSHDMMTMNEHFTWEVTEIKAKLEEYEARAEARLKKIEDEAAMVISKTKNYDAGISRLLSRMSSIDASLVSLKSSCLTKEAEYMQKFLELETANDDITKKMMELPPITETTCSSPI